MDSYAAHGRGVRRVSRGDSDVGRLIDVDVNTYLPGDLLVKVDITTMANSLEARSPLPRPPPDGVGRRAPDPT